MPYNSQCLSIIKYCHAYNRSHNVYLHGQRTSKHTSHNPTMTKTIQRQLYLTLFEKSKTFNFNRKVSYLESCFPTPTQTKPSSNTGVDSHPNYPEKKPCSILVAFTPLNVSSYDGGGVHSRRQCE